MPIYEYACGVCGHRTDILHGVHDPGPNFCPECGSEGSMRKAFAPPAIVFKGSGWAKKERRSSATSASKPSSGDAAGGDQKKSEDSTSKPASGSSTAGTSSSGSTGDAD
jgi:putative FmdB family regulatory protein